MSRPIVLWSPRQATSVASDDAGTTVLKSTLPPAPNPGPYESKSITLSQTSHFIPSLAYFALKILAEYPDQLDLRSHRLYYQPPSPPSEYDILRALMPSYDPQPGDESEFSLAEVDPRLWAVLVQVYSNLPEVFHTYPIPLSDKHLPLLQRIQSTTEFSMITVLDLVGCKHLTDETTVALKDLYGLCAFDASDTVLGAYGVKVMSRTLERSEGRRRGPWGLRILRLRNCKSVDNRIYTCLSAFPLLSVVDLRGTKCIPDASIPDTFRPGSNKSLYYPTLLTTSLHILSSSATNLFSSPGSRPFILHVTSLHHETAAALVRSRPSVAMQDTYVVIPAANIKKESGITPSYRSSSGYQQIGKGPTVNIMVGNSEVLARRNKRMEELKRHERNKEAWYKRNSEEIWAQNVGMGTGMYQRLDMDAHHDKLGWDVDSKDTDEDEMDGIENDDGGGSDGKKYGEGNEETLSEGAKNTTKQTVGHIAQFSTLLSARGPASSSKPLEDTSIYTTFLRASDPSTSRKRLGAKMLAEPEQMYPSDLDQAGHPSGPKHTGSKLLLSARTTAPGSGACGDAIRRNNRAPDSDIDIFSTSCERQPSPPYSRMADGKSRAQVGAIPSSTKIISLPHQPPRVLTIASGPSLTIRPISPPTAPSIPSQIDFQNSIAGEEACELASRQAVAQFYRRSTTHSRLLPSHPQIQRSSDHDELLMLYRKPPPWSDLDIQLNATTKVGNNRPAADLAILNRVSVKGTNGLKALAETIKRRKDALHSAQAGGGTVNVASSKVESRNPFRKKEKPRSTVDGK